FSSQPNQKMPEKIENVSYITEFDSKYQKAMEMTYTLDATPRVAEFNQKMGSVAILLYHTQLSKFLLVRQFRPAVFTSLVANLPENHDKEYSEIQWSDYSPELGYTVEMCAGLIDKEGLTPEEIASEEVAEECGYNVEPSRLQSISTFVVGAHQSGNAQYLYYAEIDEQMRIGDGGGNVHEGEVISKVYWTVEEAKNVACPDGGHCDVKGPPGVLFAFQWWFFGRKNEKSLPPPTSYTWQPRNVRTADGIKFNTNFDRKKYGYNPKRMKFTLNSITRTWDMSLCPDTATCILVDSVKRELILLQTLRIQVLVGKSRSLEENQGKRIFDIDFGKSDPKMAYTEQDVSKLWFHFSSQC
uniref:Uridine diphosphate glucose pyrophosphatase NUDT14 n=2 Tax=Caenorhabditis japonica TaxID=281687 RepID=A0A8R1E1V5_CAEJA